jgi:hypothetical protein
MQKDFCDLKLVVLMQGRAIICKGEFKVKTTHPPSSWPIVVIMAHRHHGPSYGVAFSCNVSTSEILLMFTRFGLIFRAYGLFAT